MPAEEIEEAYRRTSEEEASARRRRKEFLTTFPHPNLSEVQVRQFMSRIGSPEPTEIKDALDAPCDPFDRLPAAVEESSDLDALRIARGYLTLAFAALGGIENSPRLHGARRFRAYGVVGEVLEMLGALIDRDEIGLADALADIAYYVEGTAVQFRLPLGAIFREVHRSNMTKDRNSDGANSFAGDRGKGGDFEQPRLSEVIAEARAMRDLALTTYCDGDGDAL
jgi:hypothetical protein